MIRDGIISDRIPWSKKVTPLLESRDQGLQLLLLFFIDKVYNIISTVVGFCSSSGTTTISHEFGNGHIHISSSGVEELWC